VTPEFPKRGFIYEVMFPELGRKKALVVSADVVSEFLHPVAVYVTGHHRVRTIDTMVPLRAGEGGLEANSYALCHEIWTLPQDLFDPEPMGRALDAPRMAEIDRALLLALDIG